MKEKIQEVQNYFADKIARGLYKVSDVDEFCLGIIIDRKYKFSLWHVNGLEYFRTYDGRGNYMFIKFTDKQKAAGFKKASSHVKKWEDTELKEKELVELKQLQAKYPEVKNLS